ncbi:ABC transporter ATP-binding protein [Evansella cellulosilytica]|uniref:ABC transporter related protein n=1 Tax=Evansella cellulosilytica (strain ATCC 21833 / DSM 2522 / FERM P-1141 / JCM 9156 / N-4) TaxID=649639 RepID=E6U1S2_EVAC2|nr:ABC transporter ATP-binding protein [Evansella cellulosilytica]ADU31569.1 ABC transporter related protein [Evansella cellulosilytica DSM 2522]
MSFLQLEKVEKTFFSKDSMTEAIKDINFAVNEGEFISLIGPSGCGKSTILSLISGLIRPTSGNVLLDGKEIKKPTPETGYMLQQDYLFPWLTIEENITIGLKTMGKLTEDKKKHAKYLLNEMGLAETAKQYPSELSGGMRQRVALVRMLSTQPKLLLLDEPFSALDYQTKLKLEDLVFSTIKEHKKTAILVTHDIGEAIAMSDRVILIGHSPGQIKNVFKIPNQLSTKLPFDVRNHSLYNEWFQEVWKELESLEQT